MRFLKKRWLVILVILLVAVFLRIYNIGSNPPGLDPDEAALGYNAYSILKTGKDEYGVSFPIIFKSFGDYNPGLYVYLDMPFVATMGLTETVVRLPSVISGIVIVYLTYLITKKLFKDEKLALIAMAVAATNPWLIYFSRGLQVNPAMMFTLGGIYFFLLAQASLKNNKYIILSAFSFAMTLLDYQGAKLATGVVIALLLLTHTKEVLKLQRKYVFMAIVVGIVISAPIILSFFNGQTGRLDVFSVFSYPRPERYLQDFLSEGNIKKGSLVYDMFYNEPLNFARGIMTRFFNHFSARFLFFEGDWSNPRHTSPYQGVLVVGDVLFLAAGGIAFVKRKISKETLFVILWLVIAPLPAILSRDQVHAVRSFNLAIPLIFIIAFGVKYVLENFKRMFVVAVFVIYGATYIYFLDSYFVHQPAHNSEYWQYGYKQLVEAISSIQNNYKQLIVEQSYDQPYIYFLFYQRYDPAKWQKQAYLKMDNGVDVGHVEHLDNICFCAIDWPKNRGDHGILIAGDPVVITPENSSDPKYFKPIDEIKYLDGKVAWRILEVK